MIIQAKGTLYGIGEDSVIIINGLTHKNESIHTFGWYMRHKIDVLWLNKGVYLVRVNNQYVNKL